MRLYGEYVSERLGLKLIETANGFVTYKISGKECFLSDIFVEKWARSTGSGKALLAEVFSKAKEAGCDLITANIYLQDINASSTLRAALACGFEVKSGAGNVLLIAMEMRG